MTYDIPWQPEIALRQRERHRVEFNNRNLPACSRQHSAESAASAADHEDTFARPLESQSVERMDVRVQTNAVAIGRALIAALLFVGERAASFSEAKLDDTIFGSVPKRRRTHGRNSLQTNLLARHFSTSDSSIFPKRGSARSGSNIGFTRSWSANQFGSSTILGSHSKA